MLPIDPITPQARRHLGHVLQDGAHGAGRADRQRDPAVAGAAAADIRRRAIADRRKPRNVAQRRPAVGIRFGQAAERLTDVDQRREVRRRDAQHVEQRRVPHQSAPVEQAAPRGDRVADSTPAEQLELQVLTQGDPARCRAPDLWLGAAEPGQPRGPVAGAQQAAGAVVNRALVQGVPQIVRLHRVAGVGVGDQRRQRSSRGVDPLGRRDQCIDRHRADLRRQRPGLAQHGVHAARGALDRRVGVVLSGAVGRCADSVPFLCDDAVDRMATPVIQNDARRGRANVDRQDQRMRDDR
jgi:hypothetical protein